MLLRRKRLVATLFVAGALTVLVQPQTQAEDKKAAKVRDLDIRPVTHDAWGNNKDYVRTVLLSAASELWRYFPDRPLKPILVQPVGGPITLFDRAAGGEYQMRLDTGDNLWAQWTFQFAHEFGHILSSYDSVVHQNKWFEETICEVASLFVLRRLADTWSNDPSPANWKRYAPALRKYAEARIVKAPLPQGMTLAQWYAAHDRQLVRNGYDRDKNTLVAVQLLPLFEKAPEHWEAITHLGGAKKGHSESLADYLKAWQTHCPEKHRPFVASIAAAFAIDLDKVQPGLAKE